MPVSYFVLFTKYYYGKEGGMGVALARIGFMRNVYKALSGKL
jgi:hypothetical protein